MGTDSEIVAMRAAGIGSWTMLWPVLLLGAVLSCATFYIHFREAPRAARDLERVALQGALAKLDSPVDPRNFNTLPRYVIYVRDGDKAKGIWGRVFIHAERRSNDRSVTSVRDELLQTNQNSTDRCVSH
jgi:lipopolysaccharide export system permease protein